MVSLEAYPQSQLQHVAIGIVFSFAVLALVVVCLRVYSRMTKKQFGLGTLIEMRGGTTKAEAPRSHADIGTLYLDDVLVCIAMASQTLPKLSLTQLLADNWCRFSRLLRLSLLICVNLYQFPIVNLLLCNDSHLTLLKGIRTMFVGIHITDVPPELTMETGMSWNFAAQLVYNPILACVKCSVLHFLLRLGGGLDKYIRWCIYGAGTVTILQMCIIFIVLILQCRPIEYYWSQYSLSTAQGSCINLPVFYISTASITVMTDLLVLALPIWIFLGLNMRTKMKAMIMGLFLLGGG